MERASWSARRRLTVFVILGIVAYALAMVATAPAGLVFDKRPWRTGVAGTVWNGQVGVVGGTKFDWHWAPVRSLTSLGFAADWTATGPDTDLGGRALVRTGRTMLDSVSGSAHGSLLDALWPSLPFTCDLVMQTEFPRIITGGSDQMVQGRLTTNAGTCTPRGGGIPVTVPPLLVTAEKIGTTTQLRITPAQQRRLTLIDGTLSENGTLTLRMTADGARLLSFVGIPAGVSFTGAL